MTSVGCHRRHRRSKHHDYGFGQHLPGQITGDGGAGSQPLEFCVAAAKSGGCVLQHDPLLWAFSLEFADSSGRTHRVIANKEQRGLCIRRNLLGGGLWRRVRLP